MHCAAQLAPVLAAADAEMARFRGGPCACALALNRRIKAADDRVSKQPGYEGHSRSKAANYNSRRQLFQFDEDGLHECGPACSGAGCKHNRVVSMRVEGVEVVGAGCGFSMRLGGKRTGCESATEPAEQCPVGPSWTCAHPGMHHTHRRCTTASPSPWRWVGAWVGAQCVERSRLREGTGASSCKDLACELPAWDALRS